MSNADVLLNLKKCFFFDDQIYYFGRVVKPGKLTISDKETDFTRGMQQQTNVTKLKSLFSLCNALHRFLPIFSWMTASLKKKLVKDQLFHFDVLDKKEMKAPSTRQSKLLSLLLFP